MFIAGVHMAPLMERGKTRLIVLPMLAIAGCAAALPVVQRQTFGISQRGDTLLKEVALGGHNRVRAALGLAPLGWNDTLAADARAYAEQMARSGRFEHAPHGNPPQGENLWTGTLGAYSYEQMVGQWMAEQDDYRARPVPDSSNDGRWEDVAHYTQIVWRGTTQLGCATASNARDDYLVCRYLPAGNVIGRMAY